jgi:hypothetical protein
MECAKTTGVLVEALNKALASVDIKGVVWDSLCRVEDAVTDKLKKELEEAKGRNTTLTTELADLRKSKDDEILNLTTEIRQQMYKISELTEGNMTLACTVAVLVQGQNEVGSLRQQVANLEKIIEEAKKVIAPSKVVIPSSQPEVQEDLAQDHMEEGGHAQRSSSPRSVSPGISRSPSPEEGGDKPVFLSSASAIPMDVDREGSISPIFGEAKTIAPIERILVEDSQVSSHMVHSPIPLKAKPAVVAAPMEQPAPVVPITAPVVPPVAPKKVEFRAQRKGETLKEFVAAKFKWRDAQKLGDTAAPPRLTTKGASPHPKAKAKGKGKGAASSSKRGHESEAEEASEEEEEEVGQKAVKPTDAELAEIAAQMRKRKRVDLAATVAARHGVHIPTAQSAPAPSAPPQSDLQARIAKERAIAAAQLAAGNLTGVFATKMEEVEKWRSIEASRKKGELHPEDPYRTKDPDCYATGEGVPEAPPMIFSDDEEEEDDEEGDRPSKKRRTVKETEASGIGEKSPKKAPKRSNANLFFMPEGIVSKSNAFIAGDLTTDRMHKSLFAQAEASGKLFALHTGGYKDGKAADRNVVAMKSLETPLQVGWDSNFRAAIGLVDDMVVDGEDQPEQPTVLPLYHETFVVPPESSLTVCRYNRNQVALYLHHDLPVSVLRAPVPPSNEDDAEAIEEYTKTNEEWEKKYETSSTVSEVRPLAASSSAAAVPTPAFHVIRCSQVVRFENRERDTTYVTMCLLVELTVQTAPAIYEYLLTMMDAKEPSIPSATKKPDLGFKSIRGCVTLHPKRKKGATISHFVEPIVELYEKDLVAYSTHAHEQLLERLRTTPFDEVTKDITEPKRKKPAKATEGASSAAPPPKKRAPKKKGNVSTDEDRDPPASPIPSAASSKKRKVAATLNLVSDDKDESAAKKPRHEERPSKVAQQKPQEVVSNKGRAEAARRIAALNDSILIDSQD